MATHRVRGIRLSLLLTIVLLATLSIVQAQTVVPEGPDQINISHSDRGPENGTAIAVAAQAGNVTGLVVFQQLLTRSWQGYYGNITGTVTLEDADGNIFYDWEILNPRGEIYAVNSSDAPNWNSVYCLNVTQNEGYNPETSVDIPYTRPDGSVGIVNTTRVEHLLGINQTDVDGFNETFYDFYTDTTGFSVAGDTFRDEDGCSMAHPYVNSGASTAWQELVFSDNNSLIFTSLIREDAAAFANGRTADFQMLVLEDGHQGQDQTTTDYYFYVELT